MSYRTFKHLLGETSLERKCRFIFGGGIFLLVSISFYGYGQKITVVRYLGNNERGCFCQSLARGAVTFFDMTRRAAYPVRFPLVVLLFTRMQHTLITSHQRFPVIKADNLQ